MPGFEMTRAWSEQMLLLVIASKGPLSEDFFRKIREYKEEK